MGGSHESVRARIDFLEQSGLYSEAAELVRVLVSKDSGGAIFLRIKLIVLLAKLDRSEEALEHLAVLPPKWRQQVSLLLVEAKCHFELGDQERAANAQLQAFHLEPNYHRGKSLLTLLLRLDRLSEAGELAQTLWRMDEESHAVLIELLDLSNEVLNFQTLYAAILTNQADQVDALRLREPRARVLADVIYRMGEKLLHLEPSADHVTSYNTLATIVGRTDDAIETFQALPTQSFSVLTKLSDVYFRMGHEALAKDFYERALAVDSSCESESAVFSGDEPPLIFLHRGEAKFFESVLKETRRCNPASRILVLGDDHNRVDGIEYHRWNDYRSYSRRLVRSYRHRSVNAFPFELLCLERWAVLLDFCETWGLDEIIHLDSDVVLFDPIHEGLSRMRQHDASICGTSPHVGYFRVSEIARVFDVMCSFYEKPSDFPELDERRGGFNDMTFLDYVARRRDWGNLLEPHDGSVFDHHIGVADGFEFRDQRKCFRFIDGHPYARCESSGELVRFRCIHFQGTGKSLIREFVERVHESMASRP